jgi:hypothetical protein
MKKNWVILILLAVVAGLFLLVKPKNRPKSQSVGNSESVSRAISDNSIVRSTTQSGASISSDVPQDPSAQISLAAHAASPNSTPEPGALTNEPSALPPLTVLDKTRVLMHNYHAAFGENPVGTNPEIAAALQGRNPKQINFLAESGLRLNEKGEIVDGYGTPFFFHQISGQEMEIRSAGPDKVMWTSDDLVTR